MKNNYLLFIIVFFICISCNKNKKSNLAIIECSKEIDFGTINTKDTITKTFLIKNISSVPLIIKKVKTSCGCTVAKLKDSIIEKNNTTSIIVSYIPKEDDIGKINKSIVIESNTKNVFTVLYLKGNIK